MAPFLKGHGDSSYVIYCFRNLEASLAVGPTRPPQGGPGSDWLSAVHTGDGRNPFRTALKPWLKPLFVGICRGIIIPLDFLGGAGFRPSAVPPFCLGWTSLQMQVPQTKACFRSGIQRMASYFHSCVFWFRGSPGKVLPGVDTF